MYRPLWSIFGLTFFIALIAFVSTVSSTQYISFGMFAEPYKWLTSQAMHSLHPCGFNFSWLAVLKSDLKFSQNAETILSLFVMTAESTIPQIISDSQETF